MDPRLLRYYNRELQHVREMGGEFAREFPKIAGRLGLDGFECADPYVERLLEGFAFLAARVQLKIDSEFPRFTQNLLEMVYPHYLAPTPSMAVVQFQPDLTEGALAEGFPVPRGTVLRSIMGPGDQTACEYRTAHDVTLWPVELARAEYFGNATALSTLDLPDTQGVKAAMRLRLRTTTGAPFAQTALDSLQLHLRGSDELPMQLYEQLLAHATSIVVRPPSRPAPWRKVFPRGHVRRLGFDDSEALLPYGPRSFQGYRLLHEYFAFPQRFLFVELAHLGPAIRQCDGHELEVLVLLDSSNPDLESAFDASNFALFATPAINLFPKRADRIHLTERTTEYHAVPDRTRPLDFEVFAVTGVTGFGTSADVEQEFLPFYAFDDRKAQQDDGAYFTVRRVPRMLSSAQRRQGPRSSYVGSEAFVSLVDQREAPYRSDLRQLALTTLCTNRDLPLHMPVAKGDTDFTMESGAPVRSVRCLVGPTKPTPSFAEGETAWRLISHQALNYLSLVDSDEIQGAAALREILRLYSSLGEPTVRKQIAGVKSVSSTSVVRRVSTNDRLAFGRGLEITLTCDEAAFKGTGVFLIGAVLEQFFAKYATINSFTETVLRTVERGEVMRWPTRIGTHRTL